MSCLIKSWMKADINEKSNILSQLKQYESNNYDQFNNIMKNISNIDKENIDILKYELDQITLNNNIQINEKKSNKEKINEFNKKVYSLVSDMAKTKIEEDNNSQRQELDMKFKT